MPAIRKGLTVDSGSTWTLSVRYLDSNRTPVDLTGYTATLNLFTPGRENATPLFTQALSVTNDGYINLNVTDEVTATWEAGKRAYHLDLENPSGEKQRLFFGPLEVRSGVAV